VGLLRRNCRTFAVGDPFVNRQCSRLCPHRQLCRGLAVDRPGKKKLQVVALLADLRHIGRVRQRSKGVFGGESGNIKGSLHGLLDRCLRKIRGAGVAPALPDVNRYPQRLVTVAFHVFQLAFAH
jgi:hypothetical protein